jgi:hypothetical protein
LLKNFETSTTASRTPIAEVYAFMIQDLKDAITGLPASPKPVAYCPARLQLLQTPVSKNLFNRAFICKQPNDYSMLLTPRRALSLLRLE